VASKLFSYYGHLAPMREKGIVATLQSAGMRGSGLSITNGVARVGALGALIAGTINGEEGQVKSKL
jgi:hypothetical protein